MNRKRRDFKELIGNKYNRLLITGVVPRTSNITPRVEVLCDCGNRKLSIVKDIVRGHTKSCGCLTIEKSIETIQRINKDNSNADRFDYKLTYSSWSAMKQRCINPKHTHYSRYGGRGVTIDNSWLEFRNFLADMGERPNIKHWLNRVDNNLEYSKDNCVWTKGKANYRNRRQAKNNTDTAMKILYKGELVYASDLSELINVPIRSVYKKLKLLKESNKELIWE